MALIQDAPILSDFSIKVEQDVVDFQDDDDILNI